jgi:pfkB family carbohydrate kinase
MSRLRPSPTPPVPQSTRSLRVVAAGTLFLTHTLSLPSLPGPAQTVRAHEYVRSRGGSAPAILSVLSQFHVDKCWLIASLGSSQEARGLTRELEAEGVSTRYCKVWEGAGVPAAWILHAGDTTNQSVINHNPLPDIPHEEFVSLLGPVLVPEHYPSPDLPLASPPLSPPPISSNGVTPFEWIHFEGCSVKTTLHNIQGVDSFARERRWRSQCVFSVDVGRRVKQGIEAVCTPFLTAPSGPLIPVENSLSPMLT